MKENRLFPQKCRRALLALAAAGLLSFSGALAADYADGVYQDLAPGYNDDVIVSVTVRDGKITEFDAKNRNGNESEYFGKALEGIRQAVLEKQGLDGVDAVSGATGSSDSMLTAMKGILEQLRAGGGAKTRRLPSPPPRSIPPRRRSFPGWAVRPISVTAPERTRRACRSIPSTSPWRTRSLTGRAKF